ncbi:TPA: DUF551 domain-containing protein, partial [Yersinia enterocolitica]
MTEINKEQLAVWANGYRCDSDIAIKTMAKMLFDFMDRAEKEPVTWTEMPFSFEELEQMHGATFANGYIRGWARKCESVTMKGSLYTTPQLNSPAIPEGWEMGKFGYQYLFNAIAAAVTSPHAGGVYISVKAFEDAMLAAAPQPQNQQQIIPEGWISCSNRMPEPETPVLILLNGIINIGEIRWDTPTHEETYTAFKYWDSPFIDGQPWEVYD